ncbi:type II secretion system protein [bacterium]|nr:type II secretion system protein [bacterium]
MKKSLAFTLAETLIVMGIIGVVAALTLPNLNSSTGDKEKVAKVKKIYSNLNDAYGRATAVYGPFDEWFKSDTTQEAKNKRFGERMAEFMKVSKSCGTGDGCFSSKPLLDLDNSTEVNNFLSELKSDKFYMYILADGTSIAFGSQAGYRIRIDIDGPTKGKNQEGYDIFDFSIYLVNGYGQTALLLYPSGGLEEQTGQSILYYETAWIIKNNNMDYLKCLNQLNWETKTSCK